MIPVKAKKAIDKFISSPSSLSLPYISEDDEQELIFSISAIEKMFPDWIILLCKARHKKFSYISPKCREEFGYSDEEVNRGNGDFFMQQIHPEDLDGVASCFMTLSAMDNRTQNSLDHRFILNYRFRTSKGQYIHMHDEKFLTTSSQNKLIAFTMLRDITNTSPFSGVRLKTLQKSNNRFILINEYIPATQGKDVTARESDVMTLLEEGFSTKEIANRLSVSANTVRNHKRNLFQKTKVRNRQELVKFAQMRKQK
jgi:PAS domain S-box-containing protein